MLTLEVVPERSLSSEHWEFILGMHFSHAVAIIQSQVGLIKKVHVLYNEVNPLEADLVIILPHDGIRLYFDPVAQRLKVIEIYNMKLVRLRYCGLPFNSSEVMPTVDQIERSFGATHPAVIDTERKQFMLHFRGLSFYFQYDERLHTCSPGAIKFPPDAQPLLSRMSLYCGATEERATAPAPPPSCYHGQLGLRGARVLRAGRRTRGLRLELVMGGAGGRRMDGGKVELEREVMLGWSAQHVLSVLGAPSKVFYKSEDKMRIHSPSAHRRISSARSDYFFNYFTLGLDVLFDARQNVAKKFILHTNYPGHYNFNMYVRCEFRLVLDGETVTAYTKWEDLCKTLQTPCERPVILNRSSSTNSTNPFGSTYCYGYEDVIFEVLPNGHVASLTLCTLGRRGGGGGGGRDDEETGTTGVKGAGAAGLGRA